MASVVIRLPDIGDFEDVEVIEILVAAGQRVAPEDSLITIESEKASMEIPAPRAGVVGELAIALGDLVSEGSPILTLEVAEESEIGMESRAPASHVEPVSRAGTDAELSAEVAVLGGGPGGYTAAFRAADLGKSVVLIEREPTLGGVCLNVGCIPSKALLHLAEVIAEVRELGDRGISFGAPEIDLEALRAHKDAVVRRLTDGLASLAGQRGVRVVTGTGRFASPQRIAVEGGPSVAFESAVIAVGSEAVELPDLPHSDPRVWNSTDALELREIPRRLLVIGGGVIGLELAGVYDALGSEVTVVELLDALLADVDPDLVRPLERRISRRYADVWLGTRVIGVEPEADGLRVAFDGAKAPESAVFDGLLVAVGRRPNGQRIAAELAGVDVDAAGFIHVDAEQRTSAPHIYAIGDVVGPPMLAHKATHEGKIAAEVIAGLPASFDARTIPSVAYTDPEIAWMGLSETRARAEGIEVEKASFPWAASGRALGIGRPEGLTKLLFSAETGRLLGAGIVGRNAAELIAETVLALELGADAEDLSLTIHAHPTLSETVHFAAEMVAGTITDLYAPKTRQGSG